MYNTLSFMYSSYQNLSNKIELKNANKQTQIN